MTVVFWLLMTLLTIIAMVFLLWPLFKQRNRFNFWSSLTLLLVFPVVALLIYSHVGGSHQLTHYWVLKNQVPVIRAELQHFKKHPKLLIQKLRMHLHQHPNSPKGWFLLGRLYFNARQYSQAFKVLEKAHVLAPSNSQYTVAYAEAEFFQKKHLSKKTKKSLKHILAKQPNNIGAINIIAMDAYHKKHYRVAVHYWERMIPLFGAGSNDSRSLLRMIAKAQQRLATPLRK